jgi:hypothetical protein
MKRNITQRKLKPYRIDKRHPRRAKITIEQDLGDRKLIDILTTPRFQTTDERTIPKHQTGEWQTIYRANGIKILKSKRTDRTYVFTEQGEYIAQLDDIDQAKLAIRLLESLDAFRYEVNKKIGNRTYTEAILAWRKLPKTIRPKFAPKTRTNR